MKPRDIFGIIVRTFGVILVVYSLWYLLYGLLQLIGCEQEQKPGELLGNFLFGGVLFFLATYFLRGAPRLLNFCYPSDEQDFEKQNDKP